MLFNSFHFLLFFPIVTILYFVLPHRLRWVFLIFASCIFYMAFIPAYLLILILLIIVDYFAGIGIERAEGTRRKSYLIISLISNLSILVFFKYYNFLNDNISQLAHRINLSWTVPALSMILPIGLSFHTFQAMSYTIEVYRRTQKAVRHFGIYALYVLYYPQLVAGPIERPQNLIHQFESKHLFDYQRVTDGLKQMLWGMFKKVVIADRLALYVDAVYNHPHEYSGIPLIVATVFFAFQIYCDFSGYSDIAIGASRVMGINLMTNFRRPYHASSISEFWKRWHISLSTWFRDYLYISLGGNRVGKSRIYFNLFFTFLISGVWHGASWNFILWGAINGFYLLIGLLTVDIRYKVTNLIGLTRRPKLYKGIQVVSTFSLVCFAWIFFRANNFSDAIYVITHLFRGSESILAGMSLSGFILAAGLIFFMEVVHVFQRNNVLQDWFESRPIWLRWACYYGALIAIIWLGVFENRQFIYFQF